MSDKEEKSDVSAKNAASHSGSAPANEGLFAGGRVAPLGADAKPVPPKKK